MGEWMPKSARPLGASTEYRPPSARPLSGPIEASQEEDGPGEGEALLRGAAHGASLGFAPAIAGASSAVLDQIRGDPRTLGESYDAERQDSEKKFKAAQAAHPYVYGAGDVAGNVASGLALTPLTGGASLAGAAGAGALVGGVGGLGDSVSDGADLGDTAKNVAIGATGGAVAGGLGHAAGGLLAKGIQKVAPGASNYLDEAAANQVNRAVGGSNKLSIKQLLAKRDALAALDKGEIRALDTPKSISARINGVKDSEGNVLQEGLRQRSGQIKGGTIQALDAEGVRGPSAEDLAKQFEAKGADIRQNSVGSDIPNYYDKLAADTRAKLPPNDLTHDGTLGLAQSDSMTMNAQQRASKEYDKIAGQYTEKGDALMDAASIQGRGRDAAIESATKSAAPGSRIAALGDDFVAAKAENARHIALGNMANRGAIQQANRSTIGPVAAIGAVSGHGIPALAYQGLKTFGNSTAAVAARSASKGVTRVAELAASNPQALGKFGGVLSRAVAQGPEKFATMNFVLAKDPAYQQMLQYHSDGTSDDAPPNGVPPQTP